MNENITVSKETLIDAYKNGSTDCKKMLERLYGVEMFRSKNIMEHVKTFEDAINELGKDHPFVEAYFRVCDAALGFDSVAYQKLRIITAALNDGWEPTFAKDERNYYPYFYPYTQEEIDYMNKDERNNVLILEKPIGAYAGVACASTYSVPSAAGTHVGSRLCFKTRELAEYAGKQFIDIYADYYLK